MRKTTGYDIGFRGAGGPPPFSTSTLQVGIVQHSINAVTRGIVRESMPDGWLDAEERLTILQARIAQNRAYNIRIKKVRAIKDL